jgi:hypothetical protein
LILKSSPPTAQNSTFYSFLKNSKCYKCLEHSESISYEDNTFSGFFLQNGSRELEAKALVLAFSSKICWVPALFTKVLGINFVYDKPTKRD